MAVMGGTPYALRVLEAWAAPFKQHAAYRGNHDACRARHPPDAAATLLAILITIGTAIWWRAPGQHRHPAARHDRRCAMEGRCESRVIHRGLIVFLPALWLAALYFQGWIPPVIGLIWCVGRIFYAVGYMAAATAAISLAVCIFSVLTLVVLAAIGIVQAWMASTAV